MIITRNRKELARRAIESALAQSGDPEVIVIDDVSEDGTADAVRAWFPQVRVHRSASREGYIVHRNTAVRMSTAPVVVSLDDDAVFDEADTVLQTLRLFDEPRVGAVAIPFYNCSSDGRRSRMLPEVADDGRIWVSNTFIGTAFAVRRDVFLRLGGFQEALYHWGEEAEYAMRLFGAGYVTAMGARGLILHYPEAVGKYVRTTNRYIFRNGILTPWFNAPALTLLPLVAGQLGRYALRGLRHPGDVPTILEGCRMALGTMASTRGLRRPLPLSAFRLWMYIRRNRPVALSDIIDQLPRQDSVTRP